MHSPPCGGEEGQRPLAAVSARGSADDDAFGFALPATAEADGFTAESAKGNVRQYEPGASLVASIRHGAERPGDPAGHPRERTNNDD